jgi:adenylate cyclase
VNVAFRPAENRGGFKLCRSRRLLIFLELRGSACELTGGDAMLRFLTRHAQWVIALFGFLIFGLTQLDWVRSSPLWQKADGALIDRRYLLRGPRPPDPDIKLVGIQSSAFKLDALAPEEIAASPVLRQMQRPWPWDRRVYAAVLERLMNAGAKVVVFDFVFAGETDGDDDFARALLKYRNRVVIGEMFQNETDATEYNAGRLVTPNGRLLLPDIESIVGLVNLWPDPDDFVRRVRYWTSIERESGLSGYPDDLPHISVVVLEKFQGPVALPPTDRPSCVDFQGPAGTYRPLPIENMFVNKLWQAPPFNGGLAFSNKIVIVGPLAEIFHDEHPMPFGDMPGPEIQAQIMGALLRGSWLTEPPLLANLVLALALTWFALEICLRIGNALLKVAALAAATAVFLVACQIAFTRYHLMLPMTQPLCCLLGTGSFGVVYEYALEQFERLRYRNVLERYVSKNVARTILEDRRSFIESLNGRKYAVTVLFSDIRGFTTMTEARDPEKLVAQLNEYFLEMVGVVLKEGGTLQKFIGDAIMAAWGDTHSEGAAEDARRAVSAALQMRAALARLNEGWARNPDRICLDIGIGINHGDVIVGNVGHPQRMEFTVLGDGVNLASRLESATRQFHTDILVGEAVEAVARERFIFRRVDLLAVKGKTRPVEVFTVLGDRSQPAPVWLAGYHEAIRLYRARQFAAAADGFQNTMRAIGGDDFLCAMFAERCAEYLRRLPPENWDGSYVLTGK